MLVKCLTERRKDGGDKAMKEYLNRRRGLHVSLGTLFANPFLAETLKLTSFDSCKHDGWCFGIVSALYFWMRAELLVEYR